LGEPLEGPVLQQGELSMVCVGLSERDVKNLGGSLGSHAKIFWGQCPPWHPPSSALAITLCHISLCLMNFNCEVIPVGNVTIACLTASQSGKTSCKLAPIGDLQRFASQHPVPLPLWVPHIRSFLDVLSAQVVLEIQEVLAFRGDLSCPAHKVNE